MEWVIGIAASVLSSLLVWCIKSIYSLAKEFRMVEKRIVEKVAEMVAKEKEESILAHRRLAVLDQTVGDITEDKFNSRNVAEGKEKLPKIHGAIQRILHEADS